MRRQKNQRKVLYILSAGGIDLNVATRTKTSQKQIVNTLSSPNFKCVVVMVGASGLALALASEIHFNIISQTTTPLSTKQTSSLLLLYTDTIHKAPKEKKAIYISLRNPSCHLPFPQQLAEKDSAP